MIRGLPILLLPTLCLTGSTIPPDLDVSVTPGSPITWGRHFPALMPRDKPLIPLPAVKRAQDVKRKVHTVVQQRPTETRARMPSSFSVLRILTWDIGGHLQWVAKVNPDGSPTTGVSKKEPQLPTPDRGLYWACISPLLRFMLHPRQVSRSEVIVHLVEIGEPVAAILENAASEPSLARACAQIRPMIAPGVRGASPLPGKTPRETMLNRFVAEELVREFPYDPEGGFGRRLVLFGEEILPILIQYADHKDSFLRRNAVTALGRYRTKEALRALNEVAAKTQDPVALMRSLSALGGHRTLVDAGSLLARLAKATDAVDTIEEVAIIAALGRCYRREAIPVLLEHAGDNSDLDRQLAALTALVRIRHAPKGDAVRKLANKLSELASKRRSMFEGVTPPRAPPADIPDRPGMRALVIEQLALLLRVRLNAKDDGAARKLLKLAGKKPRRRAGERPRWPGARGPFPSTLLNEVMPAVQMLYLETLRELGKKGIATLRTVASTPTIEPLLRGQALLYLPANTREETALEILDNKVETSEMRIYALEALARSGSSKLLESCESLLEKGAAQNPNLAKPQDRYLWLEALRTLDRRKALTLEKLKPLLKYVGAAREAERGAVIARIKELIDKLIENAISRKKRKHRGPLIKELLDLVIENKLRPYISETTRAAAIKNIKNRLEALRSRPKNALELTRSALLTYLTGGQRQRFTYGNVDLKAIVLLEEEILFAMGRLKTKEAANILAKIIADHPSASVRAHACLALGLTEQQSMASKLVPSLVHADGFVRFCAYEALRGLTGQEFWADWMFGERAQWVAAAEKYMRWLGRRR